MKWMKWTFFCYCVDINTFTIPFKIFDSFKKIQLKNYQIPYEIYQPSLPFLILYYVLHWAPNMMEGWFLLFGMQFLTNLLVTWLTTNIHRFMIYCERITTTCFFNKMCKQCLYSIPSVLNLAQVQLLDLSLFESSKIMIWCFSFSALLTKQVPARRAIFAFFYVAYNY